MSSSSRKINAAVRLPIEVKLFRWNRRLCMTVPKDLSRLLDINEDDTLSATIIEGGLALFIKRRGDFLE